MNARATTKSHPRADLKEQHAELLAALERVVLYSRPKAKQVNLNLAIDRARQVIRKATGTP
jgi:hypothetical protein